MLVAAVAVLAAVAVVVLVVVVVVEMGKEEEEEKEEVEDRGRTQEQESSGDFEKRADSAATSVTCRETIGVDAATPPEKNSRRSSHVAG